MGNRKGRLMLTCANSVALIVQIHLQQNRTDLAAKEAQRARKWAQDSLLVNIAESWVGMREVQLQFPSIPAPILILTNSTRRAAKNTNLPFTSSKSSPNPHNRNPRTRSSPRPFPNSTWGGCQKPKQRCSKLLLLMQSHRTRLQTLLC